MDQISLRKKYRFLSDDVDEGDIPPTTTEILKTNEELNLQTHFGEKYLEQFNEKDLAKPLSPEERREIEEELAQNGFNRLCRCNSSDFRDEDITVRHNKAMMVNLYFEYGGNWAKVFKDSRSMSRRAMAVYWRDDLFRSYIEALDPILMLEARGVVVEVWKDGLDEKARLAAALRFLEYADAKNWDRGVKRQIVANKGSLQSALFNRVISDEEFIGTYIKDKLNKLPENVRSALEQTLQEPPEAPAPSQQLETRIAVADMKKLKDPFGEYDETKEGESL